MDEMKELSHDQLIARVQAFYSHLRKNYESLRLEKMHERDGQDEELKHSLQLRYEDASETLDLYSHAFEKVIYTWMD